MWKARLLRKYFYKNTDVKTIFFSFSCWDEINCTLLHFTWQLSVIYENGYSIIRIRNSIFFFFFVDRCVGIDFYASVSRGFFCISNPCDILKIVLLWISSKLFSKNLIQTNRVRQANRKYLKLIFSAQIPNDKF